MAGVGYGKQDYRGNLARQSWRASLRMTNLVNGLTFSVHPAFSRATGVRGLDAIIQERLTYYTSIHFHQDDQQENKLVYIFGMYLCPASSPK